MKEILENIENNHTVFQYYNANPKGKNTTDCVVRAIAAATGMTWEDVLLDMTKCALKYKLMVDDPALYSKYLKEKGWTKHNQPRRKNGTKFKASEWAPTYKGVAVAHIGSHHMAMISHGKVWDTWYSADGIIGNYWSKP
jgi:hypothetical protein